MNGGVLILAEYENKTIKKATLELLSKGRELADELETKLRAILIGDDVKNLASPLIKHGADQVIIAEGDAFKGFNPHVYLMVLRKAMEDFKPKILLFSHQFMDLDLAPCLAANLNATLVSNCVDMRIKDGELILHRSIYGDKIYAEVIPEPSTPIIISARSGIAIIREVEGEGTIMELKVEYFEVPTKVLRVLEEKMEADITKANVIVSAGRGIGERENLKLIKDLAEALSGTIASSRPLIDIGWIDKSYQVGISGKKVSPKLYIACGISGQSQHIDGMSDSEVIIAINKDPTAPIFNVADYGIVGNLLEVVPALTEYIKQKRKLAPA